MTCLSLVLLAYILKILIKQKTKERMLGKVIQSEELETWQRPKSLAIAVVWVNIYINIYMGSMFVCVYSYYINQGTDPATIKEGPQTGPAHVFHYTQNNCH